MFYWKSANLFGSVTVFYSPIENSRARVALGEFFLIFAFKVHKVVGF